MIRGAQFWCFPGDTLWNPWQRGSASLHAPLGGRCSDHPPGPLPGRKGEENSGSWRDTLQTSCRRGCTPLDSPLTRVGGTLWNPWQRGFVSLHAPLGGRCSDHPHGPFLEGRGKKIVEAGGTPSRPPAGEVAPLWTPRLHVLGDTPRLLAEVGAAGLPLTRARGG